MAKISIRTIGNWNETAVSLGIRTPKAITDEIRLALSADMRAVRAALIPQLTGGVLGKVPHNPNHPYHGELARSVKARVTLRNNVIRARAGSSWFTGRFWEDGFNLKSRDGKTQRMQRRWAAPVTDAAGPKVAADIEDAIARGIKKAGF